MVNVDNLISKLSCARSKTNNYIHTNNASKKLINAIYIYLYKAINYEEVSKDLKLLVLTFLPQKFISVFLSNFLLDYNIVWSFKCQLTYTYGII